MLCIFQGAESVDHVATLESVRDELFEEAPSIAVSISYKALMARKKDASHMAHVASRFTTVLEGGHSGDRSEERAARLLEQEYYEFLSGAPESVMAVQFDHPALPPRGIIEPRVIPLVFDPLDPAKLKELLELGFPVAMGMTEDPRVGALLRRYSDRFALALGSPDLASATRAGFTAAMTSAWYAPGKFGEISLWDGTKFHRRNSTERKELLKRSESYLAQSGFDLDLLHAVDSREMNRLAAWSFLMWAASFPDLKEDIATESAEGDTEQLASESEGVVMTFPGPERKRRGTRPVQAFPGFRNGSLDSAEERPDGTLDIQSRPVLESTGESLRACNSCFLSATCPAYEQNSKCAFNFPVEVRTPTQVRALLSTMVEVQAGRVAFARFAEEVNGGYPDEVVGSEMDRLFKMADQLVRPVKREKLTVSLESETHGGGTGVLSAIFGPKAAVPSPELPVIEGAPMHVVDN